MTAENPVEHPADHSADYLAEHGNKHGARQGARQETGKSGQAWMVVLVVLALVATVIMLFTNSAMWLQLALLAALWASVVGIMLVGRLKHDRDQAVTELELQQRAYEAELEAERARNDADHVAKELERTSQGSPSPADQELLREIREELLALRARLEELSGQAFDEQRVALQAEARRVRELEAQPTQTAQPAQPAPAQPAPAQPAQPTQPAQSAPAQPAQPAVPKTSEASATPMRTVKPRYAGAEDDTTKIDIVRDSAEEDALNALVVAPNERTPRRDASKTDWTTSSTSNSADSTSSSAPSSTADSTSSSAPSSTATSASSSAPNAASDRDQEGSSVFRSKDRRPQGAPSNDVVAGRVGSHRAPDGHNPLSDLIRERQAELEREKAERAEREKREEIERRERFRREEDERRERAEREQRELRERAERERQAREQAEQERAEQERQAREQAELERAERERQAREQAEREAAQAEQAEQQSRYEGGRGRRRADERGGQSVSVADLIARSKGN